jgi:II/X family phage/plasmid replication protein
MIDKLKLSLFLTNDFLEWDHVVKRAVLNYSKLNKLGFKVYAGDLNYEEIDINGEKVEIPVGSNPQCPWGSIPSSYSGLAVKWWDSNSMTSEPRLEIKGSPAKLMQGHNVFGSTSIEKCAFFMMKLLQDNYPELINAIDWKRTTFDLIDVTYSAHLQESYQEEFISWLGNVSNKQLRSDKAERYKTSCYWNKSSKTNPKKCYLKYPELMNDLGNVKKAFEKNPYLPNNKTRIDILEDERLLELTKTLVRFEATLKKDWFNYNLKQGQLPLYLKGHKLSAWIRYQKEVEARGECLIQNLWLASFDSLFDALNGEAMKMTSNEQVLVTLKNTYYRDTKNGRTYAKATKVYQFYEMLITKGYKSVYELYKDGNRAGFKRLIDDLIIATGLSKGQLQNLHAIAGARIIPFCNLINIEFNNQVPEWAKVA